MGIESQDRMPLRGLAMFGLLRLCIGNASQGSGQVWRCLALLPGARLIGAAAWAPGTLRRSGAARPRFDASAKRVAPRRAAHLRRNLTVASALMNDSQCAH